ncbi:MAG: metallopeptidase family protein [Pseudomonadota bacterium]|nr:metallopeptidase family protein [Pseudomonadota bacterium]
MVDGAFARLPRRFRDLCKGVALQVLDFPEDDVLQEMGIESPFDLLGLYQGVSLDQKSTSDLPHGPDMVFLYRRPILDHWAEGGETLGKIITHVLIHEFGHHFGLSDDDMERIESEAGD